MDRFICRILSNGDTFLMHCTKTDKTRLTFRRIRLGNAVAFG